MEWKHLETIEITENWQLITSDAEIFRVTHLSVSIEKDYIKAVVAQAFQEKDEMITIFSPQIFSCRQEREIITLPILIKTSRAIGFKRLDKSVEIIWKVKLEYYE